MADDNISLQADEVEALGAIYGKEWCILNAASRTYCIKVEDKASGLALTLHITLEDDYPSKAPPQYSISAHWLRGSDRQMMQNQLEEIYIENMGESIIYLWVEKLREILTEHGDELKAEGDSPSKEANTSQSTAHSDSGFALENAADDEQYTYKEEEYRYQKYEAQKQEEDACPEIFHGGPVSDRKSTFQGHIAKVTDKEEVDLVMAKLLENKKIASATHNIVAYRIQKEVPRKVLMTGCEDDGEIHAGNRVLHLMQLMNAVNVLVVITRWYGGVHLGPDRFKHINNCARELLEEHGYRNDSDDKKGPRSKKKSPELKRK